MVHVITVSTEKTWPKHGNPTDFHHEKKLRDRGIVIPVSIAL